MGKLQLSFNELDSQGRRQNPSYIARIHSDRTEYDSVNKRTQAPISIELQLPEQFNFSLATAFQQPFAQSPVKAGITDAASMLGFTNFVTQAQTVQVWHGTSEVSFMMTFELFAETDALIEVVQPIKDLLYLMLPGKTDGSSVDTSTFAGKLAGATLKAAGLLIPPGPSLDRQNIGTYKNVISLTIGKFMRFDSVVIESVNHVFDSHFDYRGLPLGAQVDVSFKTFLVPVREDLDKLFFGGSAGSGQGATGPGTAQDARLNINSVTGERL